MIYKWNIVDTETFEELLKTFWNKLGKTPNLVLEIQNFQKPDDDFDYPSRIFFGTKININDWAEDNKDALEKIKQYRDKYGLDPIREAKISMCITDEYGRPIIIPIKQQALEDVIIKGIVNRAPETVENEDPYYKMLSVMASSFTNVKLIKDSKGVLKLSNYKKSKGKAYVRTRVMNYKDWLSNMKYFTESGEFKTDFVENDINI